MIKTVKSKSLKCVEHIPDEKVERKTSSNLSSSNCVSSFCQRRQIFMRKRKNRAPHGQLCSEDPEHSHSNRLLSVFNFSTFSFYNVSMVAEAARGRRKPRWLLSTNVCFGADIRFVMFHLNHFIFNKRDINRPKHLQHDCDLWVTHHLPAVMLSLTYLPKKKREKMQ